MARLNIQNLALKANKGMAALPTVLLFGGIIAEISITVVFLAYYFNQSNSGVKLSAEALSAANAGVQDALVKIIRDKNFSSPNPYSLAVGNRSASVIVCKDIKADTTTLTCTGNLNSGKDEIISTGSAITKKRRIQASINVDPLTGEAKIEYYKEIPL